MEDSRVTDCDYFLLDNLAHISNHSLAKADKLWFKNTQHPY